MSDAKALKEWITRTGLENIIWATDLDLTVLDNHANPDKVAAPAGLQEACAALDRQTAGRFFIITGREMSYVDAIFPDANFKASCEYHNMFRLDDGQIQELSPRPQWHLIDDAMAAIVAAHPGMALRHKPFMRSLHYSHAEDLKDDAVKQDVIAQLQTLLDSLHEQTGQKLRNTDGGKVFDMGPDGLDKGEAYEAIITYAQGRHTADTPLMPLYFGDSPGDLPAAAVVRAQGGVFVSVGPDPRVQAVADFKLDNPAECRALITALAVLNKPERGRDTSRKPGFEP